MARLNVEDSLWSEIGPVIAAAGDQDRAIGNVIRFFKFAQDRHRKGRLISEQEFQEMGFLEALIPIFAKRTPSGIQAKGAEKHFSWLEQKVRAGASGGRKSATRKRNASGHFKPRKEIDPSEPQAEPKHTQASISISSSLSLSNSRSSSSSSKEPSGGAVPANAGSLIAHYCDQWRERYRAKKSPVILPQHAKALKGLLEQVGIDRGKSLIDGYLSMPDQWFVTKSHDIPTLIGNLNKVTQFIETGRMVTRTEVRQLDEAVAHENVRQQIITEGV